MEMDLTSQSRASLAEVSAVLISSRESPEILWNAIEHAVRALRGFSAVLDVLVNGNPRLADAIAVHLRGGELSCADSVRIRCWSLLCGDKAHAWNIYVHELWPGGRTTVFMDGYIAAENGSIRMLDSALRERPHVLAATGVPSVGLSANRIREMMMSSGGIHGNLFGLRDEAMNTIRHLNFRLPLGLYRVDSMIGAAVFKQFLPLGTSWDVSQVLVLPEVTWTFQPLRWWSFRDVRAHLKRRSRQAQGKLENLAFRNFFITRKQPLDRLPRTAREMVENWVSFAPEEASQALRAFGSGRRALSRLRTARDWSLAEVPATLLFDSMESRFGCDELSSSV